MSVSRHHADWLSLVESSGPFLSLPVLLRVFPQGLDPRDPEQVKQLRLAYEEWQDKPDLAGKQRAWIMHVLAQALGYPPDLLSEGQALPPGLSATMAEYGETLRPDLAVLGPASSEQSGKPQLLVSTYPAEQSLDTPVGGKHWKASPATRMMELLHAADVPLGLVTNGEQWMLVFAPRGETTGFTSWFASLWIDEPITLRAFLSLVSARRFFGVGPKDTLLALLNESAQDQQEVTNQLGDQVRDAVEVLIQAFDRLDQDSGRMLLKGADEKSLYDAALTVMMRLVFLFSAEERGLLHLGKPIYDDNYAVSTLREQLQEVADHYGEEVLERRNDAWARLLATFRAVHTGVDHQDLMLPAYGGSLFDPDRYPFLEGRPQGSRWQVKPAEPLEINNRVVLHLLKSLQMLQVKIPGGGPVEARRISFRALDIEQIGHIYEGLLDHTAVRAKEVVLGLAASRNKPVASIALAELEKLRQDGAKLLETLEEETGRSSKALEKGLKSAGEAEDFHKILVACSQDQELAGRVMKFGGLLRKDSFERPVVVLPGGVYVGEGSARRSTGTHYTPRSLTEPIVQHTLESLVYVGPAEGLPKEQWRLKSPKEILDLKVCDMTMGSGAFLVQACRYLSERLVESWENLEKEHPGEVLTTPDGGFSHGEPSERLIPKETAERLGIARRLVADRCVYGVDINPMAVEMAKLSIWLITLDKSRPFTFLDHALKCGDSLLGVSTIQQIENFSLRTGARQVTFATANLFRYVDEASAKRRALEELPSNDHGQIEAKTRLHAEAEAATAKVKALADVLIAFELRGFDGSSYEQRRTDEAERVQLLMKRDADASLNPQSSTVNQLSSYGREQLRGQRTFNWLLEFPEVFARGGFDAFVGNPPFMGGKKISGAYGGGYRDYLLLNVAGAAKGNTDLCAFFFLRSRELLKPDGGFGLIATNTIAQGDTREVGLDQILSRGCVLQRAISSRKWPGSATVEVSHVWGFKGEWDGEYHLDEIQVPGITSFLTEATGEEKHPQRLLQRPFDAFIGLLVNGIGFVLAPEEAAELLRRDPRNKDVLFKYLNGQNLNSSPDQSSARWIIYFRDWPLTRNVNHPNSEERAPEGYEGPVAEDYPLCLGVVRERVKPTRDKLPDYKKRVRDHWWRFEHIAPALDVAITGLQRFLARARVANLNSIAFVQRGCILSEQLVVFASDSDEAFALLQSCAHTEWLNKYSSSMRTDVRYTPSDCFDTFPFPQSLIGLADIGRLYYEHRRKIMLDRSEGLTDTYNRFHDQGESSEDIEQLRSLHVEMDQAVATAYGWSDLDLGHGFHEIKQGVRYTISGAARRAVLDRLLALNQQRYEEQVSAGLQDKKTSKKRSLSKAELEKTASQGSLL